MRSTFGNGAGLRETELSCGQCRTSGNLKLSVICDFRVHEYGWVAEVCAKSAHLQEEVADTTKLLFYAACKEEWVLGLTNALTTAAYVCMNGEMDIMVFLLSDLTSNQSTAKSFTELRKECSIYSNVLPKKQYSHFQPYFLRGVRH